MPAVPNMDPPAELSPYAAEIWRRLVPSRARSTGRLVLLHQALLALDEANECNAILRREGRLAPAHGKSKMLHAHPLLKVRDEALAVFTKAWARLSLEFCSIDGMVEGTWQKQVGIGLPHSPPAAASAAATEN